MSTVGHGVQGFIADLAEWGAPAKVVESWVVFPVRAPSGVLEGEVFESAVAVSELSSWPLIPPHWVHFPSSVTLPQVHADQSDTQPGWTRHSRQIERWEQVTEPGRAWLGHARATLAGAS
ncbi:hypothetical protein [Microbacterium sp. NPDC077184]|uniref:hypothetical protein n=1 Tax=Microbacterium sp. NPDC077184 TaxID=3154764 RepID=UPI00343A7613